MDVLIFFFQAEDGIRDDLVTGVQTCALPIYPRIVIGVPSEITQVEKRAVSESAYRAKASEVHLVEQAMVAAIGAGLPITEPAGNMVVDIGGGTTDVAVLSLSRICYSRSVRGGADRVDDPVNGL